MSLFSTIQQSSNALQVSELGLHVVGNNIANANTPGYIRQDLIQTSGPGVKFGGVTLGYGVRATGVVQRVDEFVVDRLRQTESSLASSSKLDEAYSQLESLFGELSDNDLSSQLSEFSSSIQDVLNQPGNESLRRLVLERGRTLTTNIRGIAENLNGISRGLNQEVYRASDEINRLTKQIAALNQRVVELEGGGTNGSDAVGVRDERILALKELAKIVDIRAVEQKSGAVTVYVGGEYLVVDSIQRSVTVAIRNDETSRPEVRLADTNSPLNITGGSLHGIYTALSGAIGGSLEKLDAFAQDLIQQFNQIHTQGQGLSGFSDVTSTAATDDRYGPLDLAGYPAEIRNGGFEIQVTDLSTGELKTHSIRITLTGGTDDTSLEDVQQAIENISGLSAQITPEGELRIESSNHQLQFSFGNDTSNFLAAAGINTFFVGSSASTIDINSVLAADPRMFAASLTGVGGATDNAVALSQAFDSPLAELGGRSIKQTYEDIVVTTTQDINIRSGITEGLLNFQRSLESKHLSISGVNLDEEAIKMIFYQRAFQASSRVIKASSEMLEVLVNL